jgi:hypothetical protein
VKQSALKLKIGDKMQGVSRETLKIKSNFPVFKKMFHVKQKQLKI